MANKYNQKIKILYILKNLMRNSDENNPLDTESIILDLKNHGIEAERKSIYKDVSVLQEFGYDIIKTRTPKSGYFIADREFEVAEIRLLCDAIQAANFITQKKTKQLLSKIYSLVSTSQAEKIKNQVYVDNRPKCTNENIYYTIDKLHTAIQDNRQVQIEYRKRKITASNETQYETKTHFISPYALIWSNDHYYLVGNNRNYSNIMITRVDRIKSVEVLTDSPCRSFSDVSEYKDYFDSADYANKHFSMFSGDPESVELICSNELIDDMIDKFGDNVPILKHGDERFKIIINAAVSEGLVSWIIQYGNKIEVKKPDSLKRMILDRIDEIKKVYRIL